VTDDRFGAPGMGAPPRPSYLSEGTYTMYRVHHNRDGIDIQSAETDSFRAAVRIAAHYSGYSERRAREYLTGQVDGWDYGFPDDRVMPTKTRPPYQDGVWVTEI